MTSSRLGMWDKKDKMKSGTGEETFGKRRIKEKQEKWKTPRNAQNV